MVQVFDPKKEWDSAANELRWLPGNDIKQTIVWINGKDNGVLYWMVVVFFQVRQSQANVGPLYSSSHNLS
jgi:hypothetical protein